MVKTGGIAVIGAGIAGLAAAKRLAVGKREVVVFDKARGVGGRTSTRRRESAAFDHGAQYFTCRTDRFQSQVDDWCARGIAAPWTASIASIECGVTASTFAGETRYVGVPSMSALARDLSTGLSIQCGQRIERITKTGSNWCLVTESGSTIAGFETVVVATPAPQAVPLVDSVPLFAELVAKVEVQPCHAVMSKFREPLGVDFDGAFVSDSPLAWLARNSSKPERPDGECWVLHTTPEWSARNLDQPSERVAEAVLGALSQALGRELPSPTDCAVHTWRFARTVKPLGTTFLWDTNSNLGVCGDWTLGARVEDAYTSGGLLAEAVLGERANPRPGLHEGGTEHHA